MKVSVVGGGNAAVFTALYFAWHGKKSDYRNNFQRDIEGIKQGQLSEYQRFYGSYGQDVLNMVPALASTGAFVDPELGIPEDEISFGFETQEGDDSDYQTYNACYNGCVEDGNPHWECATACLD